MSARQRQRLEKSLGTKTKSEDKDEIEEAEETIEVKRPAAAFRALAIDDDDESSEDEEDDDKPATVTAVKPSTGSQSTSKKKKKKAKQKKKSAAVAKSEDKDDEDRILEQFAEETKQKEEDDVSKRKETVNRLAFAPESLDADREVKRKLGRGLSSGAKKPAAGPKPRGGARRVLPPGVTLVGSSHTSSVPRLLVTPDPDWFVPPTYASGEGARMMRVKDNEFTFEASSSYRAAQAHYRQLVQTYDPNLIMQMIQEHPFHVDSLLQLHDVFQSSGQNETAQMMLRRALFTLESWCSPAFRTGLGTGDFRLMLSGDQFITDEDALLQFDEGGDSGLNGALIRALAISMRVAGRRDCFETSFNLAKFLLSLCPDRDPTFALLSVDYYALKNRSFQWVADAHSQQERDSLPSVAYARAIAVQSLSKMPDSTISRTDADNVLKEAVMRFPKYAELVLEEARREDPPSLTSRLALAEKQYRADGVFDLVDRLCTLSFTRQSSLWTEDLVAWLFDLCKRAGVDDASLVAPSSSFDKGMMTQYARCRISDLTDKVNLIPREELMADEDERMNFVEQAHRPRRDLEEPPARPNVNLNLNDLLLLLQTAMPWARLPERRGEGEEGAAEGDDYYDEWDDGDGGGEDVE